jgi:hypothetical protein
MRSIITLLFILTFTMDVSAQQTANTSGKNVSQNNTSVSYSIGEVYYNTTLNSNSVITQGIQQPYEIYLISGIGNEKDVMLITAFPNPTSTVLKLLIQDIKLDGLNYKLYDLLGKEILSGDIQKNQTELDLNNLMPAVYFIKVFRYNSNLKYFKIIKK